MNNRTQVDQNVREQNAGCIVVIAIGCISLGAGYMWSAAAGWFTAGFLLLALVVLAKR